MKVISFQIVILYNFHQLIRYEAVLCNVCSFAGFGRLQARLKDRLKALAVPYEHVGSEDDQRKLMVKIDQTSMKPFFSHDF